MFKKLLLLLLGFIISHIITVFLLAALYNKPFYIYSPFLLVSYCISIVKQHQIIPKLPLISVSFYLIFPTIILSLYQIFYEENPDKKNKYGYAKFAGKDLIKKMGLNFDEGVVFGILRRNLWQSLFNPLGNKRVIKSNHPLSTMIIAPTGTGKTAGFIIPTLKSLNNSVVVFDIKGELFQKTSQDRINLGHKILIFDVEKDGMKFNPFAKNQLPKDPRRLKSYIKNISNLIFDGSLSGEAGYKKGDNYFTNSAKELFNTIALYLITQNGFTTIPKIKELLLGNNNARAIFVKIDEKLKDQLSEEKENQPHIEKELLLQVQQGMAQILQISEAKDQFLGVIGSLTTILSTYDDMEIQEIINCENSSVVADNLRKEKITIFIRVKDVDMERLKPLVALFFETLITDLISSEASDKDNQITFVLDEFGNLGKVSKLIKATTISRSYKLNQIFILQDLAQIASIYSNEERSILEANTAYKIILQQNNFDTAKRISEIIGFKTDTRISKSSKESKTTISHDSISKSQEGIYLVTPQDILNLNKNQCLIIVQGFAASIILADIAWWFKIK